jgi:hypothetical protein
MTTDGRGWRNDGPTFLESCRKARRGWNENLIQSP